MPFEQQPRILQEPQIEEIQINLRRSTDAHGDPDYSAIYAIQVTDQHSFPMATFTGDLIPHLTAQQKTQLLAFIESMWDKAEAEVLPE